MQNTSPLYRSLFADTTAVFETKATIATIEYTQNPQAVTNKIVSMTTSGTCFASGMPSIGGCIAKEIDLTVIGPKIVIPKAAEIRPYVRLTNGTETSEWIPKGYFYIDTRQRDVASGQAQYHGYDAIIRMSKFLYRALPSDYATSFSWSSTDTMDAIADWMGVEIDSRSNIVECQIYDPRAETQDGYGPKMADLIKTPMRTVAGWIAAASGGNWIMTDTGNLRLLPATPHNYDTQYVYTAASSIQIKADSFIPWTGVSFTYEGKDEIFVGDETGRVMEATCPFATAQMAQDILSSLTSLYIPHNATGVYLDPAMELGDMIYAGRDELYPLMLSDVTTTYSKLCTSSLRADDSDEIEHEYSTEDVARTLEIQYQYRGQTMETLTMTLPDGYFYNIPNPYLEI